MIEYNDFSCARARLRQWEKCLSEIKYFLVDNGSYNPEATLSLRKVAASLSEKVGFFIRPVGLMHSHKVDSSKLLHKPAESMDALLTSDEPENWQKVVMVPLFFGPSLAITDWLPKKLTEWKNQGTHRNFEILPCLHQAGDQRISKVILDYIFKMINKSKMDRPFVALVDHGTPLRAVNQIREEIGSQMKERLKGTVKGFATCCMERREGSEYDFNDPLLESLIKELEEKKIKKLVLAQLFLSPGRHAGKGGDLEEICSKSSLEIDRTELLANHPAIIEILKDRILNSKLFETDT